MTAFPIERFLSTSPLDLSPGAGSPGIFAPGPDTSFRDHLRDRDSVPTRQDYDEPAGSSTPAVVSKEPEYGSVADDASAPAEQPTDDNRPAPTPDDSRPTEDAPPTDDTLPTDTDVANDADAATTDEDDDANAANETASPAASADAAVAATGELAPSNPLVETEEVRTSEPGQAVVPDEASTSDKISDSAQAARGDGSAETEPVPQTENDSTRAARPAAVEAPSDTGAGNPAVNATTAPQEAETRPAEVSDKDLPTTALTENADPDEPTVTVVDEPASPKRSTKQAATEVPGESQAKTAAAAASPADTGEADEDATEDAPLPKDRRDPAGNAGRQKGAESALAVGNRAAPRAENGPAANPVADAISTEADLSRDGAEAGASRGDATESAGANASPSHAPSEASPTGTAIPASGRPPAPLFSRGADRTASSERLGDVETTRLVQRVARAFKAAESRGGEIRLRLSPPELGALRIELRVDAGVMRARLEAETYTARNALLDNLPALRDRLAEQNIRIDQFDVDLMDRRSGDLPENANRRPDPSQTQTTDNNPVPKSTEKEPAADPTPLGTWPTEDRGINVIA